MRGQAFACAGCQRFVPIQEGWAIEYLAGYYMQKLSPENFPGSRMPDPRFFRPLTNGHYIHTGTLVICDDCKPDGVEGVSLAEVGIAEETIIPEVPVPRPFERWKDAPSDAPDKSKDDPPQERTFLDRWMNG